MRGRYTRTGHRDSPRTPFPRRAGGPSAGSLAWAGLYNTYYWIDPHRNICGVIMMQLLPFADREAVGLLNDFQHALYSKRT